jgi:hypothetical protein
VGRIPTFRPGLGEREAASRDDDERALRKLLCLLPGHLFGPPILVLSVEFERCSRCGLTRYAKPD